MNIAGIDYSMTSPAICVHKGSEWSIANCTFYYLVQRDKHLVITDLLKGQLYPEWLCTEQRFDNLAQWASKILKENSVSELSLEGYSYGSKGAVFHIGENTGVLKRQLWVDGVTYEAIAPTAIKKTATGKGNANKQLMWEHFLEETGINLFNIFAQREGKDWNPISDIVDSYFIAKHHLSSKIL